MPVTISVTPDLLGDQTFLGDHGVRYAYAAGAMVKGIASVEMILRLARRRILGYFGSGGCSLGEIAAAIGRLQRELPPDAPWGVNFLHNFLIPAQEEALVDLLLGRGVRRIEASAFIQVTPALVRYRLHGAARAGDGRVIPHNRVMAKVSRPEVAAQFFDPPPPAIVAALLASGRITAEEAQLAAMLPLADDVCAEADSGGHTDRRVAWTLLPQMRQLGAEIAGRNRLPGRVRIGIAGGLGAPASIAAAFMLGADFVVTGSINQCTVEAGTSDLVKDMLAAADVADFDMAPAGDMFEIGAKVQVLKRGTMFAGRGQRLYELYRTHESIESLPEPTLREIETRYFGRSVAEVWAETRRYYAAAAPDELAAAEAMPRKKLGMIFRWYFVHANRVALAGDKSERVNFQIHSGPAMGAANRWLKGTELENWRARHVDELADRLMSEAADEFTARLALLEVQTNTLARRAAGGRS